MGCGPSRPVVAIRDGQGAWRERRIGGNVTHAGWEINWISAVAAGPNRVCLAWGHYAQSGNYSACSFDRGEHLGGCQADHRNLPAATMAPIAARRRRCCTSR